MPEKETKQGGVSGNNKGKKFVTFQRTPLMSTYLLAWAFGDFEFVEGTVFTSSHCRRRRREAYIFFNVASL